MKILIVDDDISLLEQMEHILNDQHYTTETADDGEKALEKLYASQFDAVILDIMMPKADGLTVLKSAREDGIDVPTLLLTAKGDVSDRIKGLDSGADDYMAKPFSMDELLARLRALLRRTGRESTSLLQVGDITLDTSSRQVSRCNEPVSLTPREFAILEFLLHNKNRVISRFSLAEHVWGDDFDPFSMSNFIDVHIKNLRQKIGDLGQPRIIQTIRSVGYIIKDREL